MLPRLMYLSSVRTRLLSASRISPLLSSFSTASSPDELPFAPLSSARVPSSPPSGGNPPGMDASPRRRSFPLRRRSGPGMKPSTIASTASEMHIPSFARTSVDTTGLSSEGRKTALARAAADRSSLPEFLAGALEMKSSFGDQRRRVRPDRRRSEPQQTEEPNFVSSSSEDSSRPRRRPRPKSPQASNSTRERPGNSFSRRPPSDDVQNENSSNFSPSSDQVLGESEHASVERQKKFGGLSSSLLLHPSRRQQPITSRIQASVSQDRASRSRRQRPVRVSDLVSETSDYSYHPERMRLGAYIGHEWSVFECDTSGRPPQRFLEILPSKEGETEKDQDGKVLSTAANVTSSHLSKSEYSAILNELLNDDTDNILQRYAQTLNGSTYWPQHAKIRCLEQLKTHLSGTRSPPQE